MDETGRSHTMCGQNGNDRGESPERADAMEDAPHVLVVDDDTRIRDLLRDFLHRHGLRVSTAANAAEARALMNLMIFDALVLDIMMPGEDGLALTRSLRAVDADIPILLLSALGETSDRIAGLAAGSDDYLPKPFDPEELLLRLRALLRRRATAERETTPATLRLGPYLLNAATGELQRDGTPLKLTGRERELLRLLARRPGQPVPREELLAPSASTTPRAVDVEIARLRRKVEEDPARPRLIRTVRGRGYMLATTPATANGERTSC